jgi:DNA polymerase-1
MLLLLDGNNLAWAGYYALERAMKPDSDERRARVASLGLASMVLGSIARDGTPPPDPGRAADRGRAAVTRVVIAFDEGRPLRRREVFPAYQTGREGDPKFVENEPTILGAVARFCAIAEQSLPVDVLRGTNTEADDLIAGAVHREPKTHKRIVSTDRDFLQLVGPKTDVYAPVKKLIIDESNFDDAVAPKPASGKPIVFPRERYLDYRALTGDPSDNLPGLSGMGPLSAAKLLRRAELDTYFGNPNAVREALERKSLAVEAAFRDGSAQTIVERNRMLMDLRRPAPCWDELDALTTRGTWDRERFEQWFKDEKISAVEPQSLLTRLESLARARH